MSSAYRRAASSNGSKGSPSLVMLMAGEFRPLGPSDPLASSTTVSEKLAGALGLGFSPGSALAKAWCLLP